MIASPPLLAADGAANAAAKPPHTDRGGKAHFHAKRPRADTRRGCGAVSISPRVFFQGKNEFSFQNRFALTPPTDFVIIVVDVTLSGWMPPPKLECRPTVRSFEIN